MNRKARRAAAAKRRRTRTVTLQLDPTPEQAAMLEVLMVEQEVADMARADKQAGGFAGGLLPGFRGR